MPNEDFFFKVLKEYIENLKKAKSTDEERRELEIQALAREEEERVESGKQNE